MPQPHDAPAIQPDANLVAGRKPVLEAVLHQPERVEWVLLVKGLKGEAVDQIFEACRQARVRFRLAARAELDRAYPGNHQGVLASLAAAPSVELEELLDSALQAPLPLLVALDQVQDTGNLGALARTLYALGGAGLLVVKHGGAGLGAGAVRASAGALLRLPVARVTNLARSLDSCLDAGFTVYCGQSGPGAVDALRADLRLPAVLVLGSEGEGIRPNVAKRCGQALAIPMARPFDSLNVAQAGAIFVARFAQCHRP